MNAGSMPRTPRRAARTERGRYCVMATSSRPRSALPNVKEPRGRPLAASRLEPSPVALRSRRRVPEAFSSGARRLDRWVLRRLPRLASISFADVTGAVNVSLRILVAALARASSPELVEGADLRPLISPSCDDAGDRRVGRSERTSRAEVMALGEIATRLAEADQVLARVRRRCDELEALIASGKTFLAATDIITDRRLAVPRDGLNGRRTS